MIASVPLAHERANGAPQKGRPLALERRDFVAEDVPPAPHAREKGGLERFALLRGRTRKIEERHDLRRHGRGLSQLSSTRTSGDTCATLRGVSRVTWISHQSLRMFTPVAKSLRKLKNCDRPATR